MESSRRDLSKDYQVTRDSALNSEITKERKLVFLGANPYVTVSGGDPVRYSVREYSTVRIIQYGESAGTLDLGVYNTVWGVGWYPGLSCL